MSERMPTASRQGVPRTATGAGKEHKQAQGKGLMFLETLPVKSSAAAGSAWRECWREHGQKRQQTEIQIIFLLSHEWVFIIIADVTLSAWGLWDVGLKSCCQQFIIQTEKGGRQQMKWFVERKTEAWTPCEKSKL